MQALSGTAGLFLLCYNVKKDKGLTGGGLWAIIENELSALTRPEIKVNEAYGVKKYVKSYSSRNAYKAVDKKSACICSFVV